MPLYLTASAAPQTEPLTCWVSQKEIRNGKRESPYACPLALALEAAGYRAPWVADGVVTFFRPVPAPMSSLSVRATVGWKTFLRLVLYDLTGHMEPFEAKLWLTKA